MWWQLQVFIGWCDGGGNSAGDGDGGGEGEYGWIKVEGLEEK